MVLVLQLNEVRIFFEQMSSFSIPFTLYNKKYITKIRYKERAFDHLHLLLAYYIFLREVLLMENVVLLYFEGI